MPSLRSTIIALLCIVLLVSPVAAGETIIAPPATAEPETLGSVRERPAERPFENAWAEPGNAGRGAKELDTPPDPSQAPAVDRLDDPVLRWLPEITAASNATGTPRSLIAGVMRLESSGEPTTVSVVGAQGLMQVMPVEMAAQGIPPELWLDPATNILAGATILAQRAGAGWEAAVAYYFGIGCDAYGTCTFQYASVVLGWANFYAAMLGDPIYFDPARIPNVPSAVAEPAPAPAWTPEPAATAAPTQPSQTAQPTLVPTAPSTAEPMPIATAAPTEAATEAVSPATWTAAAESAAEPAPTESAD